MRVRLLSLLLLLPLLAAAQDWAPVAKQLGRAGTFSNGVYKVTFPRTDTKVYVDQTKVEPATGVTSWVAFRCEPAVCIMDGDLALLSEEIDPAVSILLGGGVEITAMHNHLRNESPQVTFVHFFGRGDAVKLADVLRGALGTTSTPIQPKDLPPAPAVQEQAKIEALLGAKATVNHGVLAFSFPRAHAIQTHGKELAPAMGMSTAINIQAAADGVAAAGDFVLKESEVQAVLRTLREGGISVTAVHNHLQDENPRTVFVHFWAEGPAEAVATALKKALDAIK